jgi:DNA-binding Lrp family transcriptional regulator
LGRKKKSIDQTDLAIISILDDLGSKASTLQISNNLDIPDRTVRYRLNKLRKNGYLQSSYPLIFDRKLGLGEHIILVQEIESQKQLLKDLIMNIPYFYWINSTFGKYTGFLFNSIYSLTTPKNNEKILSRLKSKKLISDYFLFIVTNYIVTKPDLSFFDPKGGWIWNWSDWEKIIKEGIKFKPRSEINFWEEEISTAKFDYKDILILKAIKQHHDFTSKELEDELKLSERQIRRKIKRLEKNNIIKGYISVFTPDSYYNENLTYFFFELHEPNDWILSLFLKIPYQLDLFMETETKFCITFRASSQDFKGFTKSIELLKPFFSFSFLQVVPYQISDRHHLFKAYNKDKNCWETPIDKYLKTINRQSLV